MAKRPVLITRPTEDSRDLASATARAGGQPVLEPLLTIGYLDEKLDFDGLQGLIFTSANGVRAFTRLTEQRDFPVYAVGPASAKEARASGFGEVHVAAGDVEALAEMIRDKCAPQDGAFLHAAGSSVAGDLAGELGKADFEIRRVVLYSAGKADRLSQNAVDAIKSPQGCIIPLFSPRTAQTLLALVADAGLSSRLEACTALCLSKAVADKLAGSQWRKIIITSRPEQELLLARLDELLNGDDRDQDMTEDKNNPAKDLQAADSDQDLTTDLNAEALIEAFGGIRPMAHKLDVAVSTVQGWKMRNHIPDNRLEDIQRAAAENDIDLTAVATLSVEEDAPAKDPSSAEIAEAYAEATIDTEPEKENPPGKPEKPADVSPAAVVEQVVVKRGGSRVAWLALLLSLGLGGALVTQPYWAEKVKTTLHPSLSKFAPNLFGNAQNRAAEQDLAALKTTVAALEDGFQNLKETAAASPVATTNTGALEKRLRDLEVQLIALDTVSRGSAEEKTGSGTSSTMVNALETRVERLSDLIQSGRETGLESRKALQQAVTSQGEQTAAVAARLEALASRLQAAETQLASIKTSPGRRDQREVALVIAVGQLESQLVTGGSYYRSLTSLQALASDLPDLQAPLSALADRAESGVATRTELTRRFEEMVQQLRAPVQDATWDNWLDTSLANIKNLVSIRPTGNAEELPPVSQAENALAHDDLAGAIAALSPLEGANPLVADWLKAAKGRIAAEIALSELRRITIHNLAVATAPQTAAEMAADVILDSTTGTNGAANTETVGETQ